MPESNDIDLEIVQNVLLRRRFAAVTGPRTEITFYVTSE